MKKNPTLRFIRPYTALPFVGFQVPCKNKQWQCIVLGQPGNPPQGWGDTPQEAYDDWNKQVKSKKITTAIAIVLAISLCIGAVWFAWKVAS